jgi:hypothetical protein
MLQMLRSSLTTGEANNTEFLTLDAAVSVCVCVCVCVFNELFAS